MSNYTNHNNDIKDFPFQDFVSANDTEAEELATRLNLRVYNSWMLPQMVAFFGTFEAKYNDEGLIDPRAVAQHNIGKDPYRVGMWKVVHKLRRSSLVKAQSQPQYANYSALVPLIMSGMKKYQDIGYNNWSQVGLDCIMEAPLLEAAMAIVPEDMQPEDIWAIRTTGLTIKTGPKTGEKNNPLTTWKLTGTKGLHLGHLPALTQTMLAQIWVAHPSLRSKYMILNPGDWDDMPDALVDTDLSGNMQQKYGKEYVDVKELPWG